MKLAHSFLFIVIIVLSISCSKDDDGDNNNNNIQSQLTLPESSETYIYAKIGSSDLLIVHNDILSETMGDLNSQVGSDFEVHTIAIVGLTTNLSGAIGIGFALGATTPLDEIPLNTPITNIVDLNGNPQFVAGAGEYDITEVNGDETIDASSEDLDTNTVVVSITELDLTNNIISGTFSFMAKDNNTGITYDVSGGVFNKIAF